MATSTDNSRRVADALFAYGQAIRGSWADLDGRCVRDALHALHDALLNDDEPFDLAGWALDAGACLPCASWTDYCTCPSQGGGA